MSIIKECPKCRARAYVHNMFAGKYGCMECGYFETDKEKEADIARVQKSGLTTKS